MRTVLQQRRQTDGDVREVAVQRHDADLKRFVFILRERDGAFGGAAGGDGHVLRQDLLHAGGDADEHFARVKPGFDTGFREGDDGDRPLEAFRYALQFFCRRDEILRRGLWIAKLGEELVLLATAVRKQFFEHGARAFQDVRRDVLRDELVEGVLLFADERFDEFEASFQQLRVPFLRDVAGLFARLQEHDAVDVDVDVLRGAFREDVEDAYVFDIDGFRKLQRDDEPLAAAGEDLALAFVEERLADGHLAVGNIERQIRLEDVDVRDVDDDAVEFRPVLQRRRDFKTWPFRHARHEFFRLIAEGMGAGCGVLIRHFHPMPRIGVFSP